MVRSSALALIFFGSFGFVALGAGCSARFDEGRVAASASEFTVSNGHRFVVSARPDQIVLRKDVDGVAFPFDTTSLQDKAILIHPIAGKSADGVYSRVRRVTDAGENYVVDATPLTFDEMEAISEDQIVRIYLDPMHSSLAREARLALSSGGQAASAPPDFDLQRATNVRPQAVFDGLPFGVFGSDEALNQYEALRPNVLFRQSVERASFKPEVLAGWSRETGLELGVRVEMDWKSTATISGALIGEFYRSKPYEAFGAWIFVQVGVVPIPIKAGIRLRVQCEAMLVGPVDMQLDVETHARLGGSFRVRPSQHTAPAEWLTEGSWPGEVTGTGTVNPTFRGNLDASLWCSLPRIELHTEMFGVVGPVVIVSPSAVIGSEGFYPELRLLAGITGGLFGVGATTGFELPVYRMRF